MSTQKDETKQNKTNIFSPWQVKNHPKKHPRAVLDLLGSGQSVEEVDRCQTVGSIHVEPMMFIFFKGHWQAGAVGMCVSTCFILFLLPDLIISPYLMSARRARRGAVGGFSSSRRFGRRRGGQIFGDSEVLEECVFQH